MKEFRCHLHGRKIEEHQNITTVTYSPSQSAPTILKNRAPCFLKNGAPCFLQKAGWKKQGHSLFKKRRDQAASSLFELQWPWFFALCFFQKAGCPIFKKQGARFLRIVGADWLGDCNSQTSLLNLTFQSQITFGKSSWLVVISSLLDFWFWYLLSSKLSLWTIVFKTLISSSDSEFCGKVTEGAFWSPK